MSDTLSMGSPPRQANGQKERRNPSVTPRKFNRFFTPRSHGYQQTTASRRALNDITAPANNHNTVQSSPLRPKNSSDNQENQSPLLFERDLKRRKLVHTPDGSPERSFLSKRKGVIAGNGGKARGSSQNIPSSPCERVVRSTLYTEDIEELEELEGVEAEVYDDEDEEPFLPPKPVERIVPLSDRGLAGRLLQLSLGNSIRQHHEYPVNGEYRNLFKSGLICTNYFGLKMYANLFSRLARRNILILQQTFRCPHMYQYRVWSSLYSFFCRKL